MFIEEIADSSVTEAKLADGAVTEAKLADSAVTGAKLKLGSVRRDHFDLAFVKSGVTTLEPNQETEELVQAA